MEKGLQLCYSGNFAKSMMQKIDL